VLKDLVNTCLSNAEPELAQIIGDKFVIAMKAAGVEFDESTMPEYQSFFNDVINQDDNPSRFNHLGVMKSEVKKYFSAAEGDKS